MLIPTPSARSNVALGDAVPTPAEETPIIVLIDAVTAVTIPENVALPLELIVAPVPTLSLSTLA